MRWQCLPASCRVRVTVLVAPIAHAWRRSAIHGACVEAPNRRLDTFRVPFEPFVVPSHLEICPCQRIPLETPAA
ncbi:hypothetical protein C6P74_21045 [Burkholderia multivorans]|nr:hypothetical protein C6P74_21045 [Burkholderia multivorans]